MAQTKDRAKQSAADHAKAAAEAAATVVSEEVTENVESVQQVAHQAARKITPRNVAFVVVGVSLFGSGVAFDIVRRKRNKAQKVKDVVQEAKKAVEHDDGPSED